MNWKRGTLRISITVASWLIAYLEAEAGDTGALCETIPDLVESSFCLLESTIGMT